MNSLKNVTTFYCHYCTGYLTKSLILVFFLISWSRSCIVPLFKKNDVNDVNNYRGISLVSCFGKLFTSIINSRMLEWENSYNILTDAQFGFRGGLSTVDAIFALQAIIKRSLDSKNRCTVVLLILKRPLIQ